MVNPELERIMNNPYDLIKIKINEQEIYARPVAFDSVPVNTHTLLNKDGNMIRPTMVSSICPDCGQGLEVNISKEQLLEEISVVCHICINKEQEVIKRPKRLINQRDMPKSQFQNIMDVQTTVGERVKFTDELNTITAEDNVSTEDAEKSEVKKKPARKRTKKNQTKKDVGESVVESFTDAAKHRSVAKAEGISEEQDIDDADLIEQE